MEEQLQAERNKNHSFQLERDKIHSYCQRTREELDMTKTERFKKIHELESEKGILTKERATHKVRNSTLISQQQNTALELEDKENMLKNLEMKRHQESKRMHGDFEKQLKIIEDNYEKRIQEIVTQKNREILELQEKNEIEKKELVNSHETAFNNLKASYCHASASNRELIRGIKEELEDVTTYRTQPEEKACKLLSDNKHPEDELKKLQKKAFKYDKSALSSG